MWFTIFIRAPLPSPMWCKIVHHEISSVLILVSPFHSRVSPIPLLPLPTRAHSPTAHTHTHSQEFLLSDVGMSETHRMWVGVLKLKWRYVPLLRWQLIIWVKPCNFNLEFAVDMISFRNRGSKRWSNNISIVYKICTALSSHDSRVHCVIHGRNQRECGRIRASTINMWVSVCVRLYVQTCHIFWGWQSVFLT